MFLNKDTYRSSVFPDEDQGRIDCCVFLDFVFPDGDTERTTTFPDKDRVVSQWAVKATGLLLCLTLTYLLHPLMWDGIGYAGKCKGMRDENVLVTGYLFARVAEICLSGGDLGSGGNLGDLTNVYPKVEMGSYQCLPKGGNGI